MEFYIPVGAALGALTHMICTIRSTTRGYQGGVRPGWEAISTTLGLRFKRTVDSRMIGGLYNVSFLGRNADPYVLLSL